MSDLVLTRTSIAAEEAGVQTLWTTAAFLHLCKAMNPAIFDPVLADFTEADYGGYVKIDIKTLLDLKIFNEKNAYVLHVKPVTFANDGSGLGNDIVGWYISDDAMSNKYLASGVFLNAVPMQANLDQLTFEAFIEFSSAPESLVLVNGNPA